MNWDKKYSGWTTTAVGGLPAEAASKGTHSNGNKLDPSE